jgi:hypothetical protein
VRETTLPRTETTPPTFLNPLSIFAMQEGQSMSAIWKVDSGSDEEGFGAIGCRDGVEIRFQGIPSGVAEVASGGIKPDLGRGTQ